MKKVLFTLLLISSFSTKAAPCYFMQQGETDPKYSILVDTAEHVDMIRLNMVEDNLVERSMFYKTYSIHEAGIIYKVVHVNRSCGKGCGIGTFLDGMEINGVSYIPEFPQSCLL